MKSNVIVQVIFRTTLFFFFSASPVFAQKVPPSIKADLLIVGGTESGCAAAVQAARMGIPKIVLVNDIEWLGGQFSAEALGAIDENTSLSGTRHKQPFPRSGLFLEVLNRIESQNKQKYGRECPGNTRVITTVRPKDAAEAFQKLVQPYVASGQITIIPNAIPTKARLDEAHTKLIGVEFQSVDHEAEQRELLAPDESETSEEISPPIVVEASLTIDATDWGDVIKLAGAAYEFGPDLKSKYGEPLAPELREDYPVTDMNPITYNMVIVETDEYKPIPIPQGYDVRNYQGHSYPKDPLWLYASRRLIDHYHYEEVTHPDVLLLCFPPFDYPLDVLPGSVVDRLEKDEAGSSRKNIVQMTRRQRQIIFEDAKQHSLGFLYYLQTDVHDSMKDKTHSYRRFQLTDEFGTPDSMPFKPYVRESLRLRAMYMMRQQDSTGYLNRPDNYAQVMYHDGIACWQFEYDFHPTKRIFLDENNPAGPWKSGFRKGRTWGPPYSGRSLFPARSLIPFSMDGLLGAQKNLGFSSIVSAAVRLHDQSMAVGQSCGAVAAVSLRHKLPPRKIPFDSGLLAEVRNGLCRKKEGAEPLILWPFQDLKTDHKAFEAVNLLAVRGGLPLAPTEVNFHPDKIASQAWIEEVQELSLKTKQVTKPISFTMSDAEVTRGAFAILWWKKIRDLPDKPFERQFPDDADGDSIPDENDPLPFSKESFSWSKAKISIDQDGLPNPVDKAEQFVAQFNFSGADVKTPKDFQSDTGLKFDTERGYGWSRDLSSSHRERSRVSEKIRDTFLFTRSHDTWEYRLPKGTYDVTICIGDAGHEQFGQNVTVEGTPLLRDVLTPEGFFQEKSLTVEVKDGLLTVEIGLPDSKTNTCLNWLRITKRRE